MDKKEELKRSCKGNYPRTELTSEEILAQRAELVGTVWEGPKGLNFAELAQKTKEDIESYKELSDMLKKEHCPGEMLHLVKHIEGMNEFYSKHLPGADAFEKAKNLRKSWGQKVVKTVGYDKDWYESSSTIDDLGEPVTDELKGVVQAQADESECCGQWNEKGECDCKSVTSDKEDYILTPRHETIKRDGKKGGALRYNTGKLRYELIPHKALRLLAEVYTKGAHKYSVYRDEEGNEIKGSEIPFEDLAKRKLEVVSDGADNWRLGQNWLGSMASVERHISDWKHGEDRDPDPAMGTYHLANAAWGLFALLEYYTIYPQGDDRKHNYLTDKKIGLDIDEVLCDWVGDWCNLRGVERPSSWYFDRELVEKFEEMKEAGELDEFYMNLKPLIDPKDIPFEPHCYITSRPVDSAVTEQWLAEHGFPARPVFTTEKKGKVDIALEQGLDVFVDDNFSTFAALNKAGVTCYLMDAKHNERYDVGYRRIKSLKELV